MSKKSYFPLEMKTGIKVNIFLISVERCSYKSKVKTVSVCSNERQLILNIMKHQKCPTVGLVPKSKRKIAERGKMDTHSTQTHDDTHNTHIHDDTPNTQMHDDTHNTQMHDDTHNTQMHDDTHNTQMHDDTPNTHIHDDTPNTQIDDDTPNTQIHDRSHY